MIRWLLLLLLSFACHASQDWTEQMFQRPVTPLYWPSPDGQHILLATVDAYADKPAAQLQLLGQSFHPAWPMELSQQLYRQLQIARISPHGVALETLQLPGPVADFQWSADSRQLAVVVLEHQPTGAQLRLWRYLPNERLWQQWPSPPLSAHGGKPLVVWAADQLIVRTALPSAACETAPSQVVWKKTVQQQSLHRLYRDLVDTPLRQCQFVQARQQQLLSLSAQGHTQHLTSGLIDTMSVSPDGHYLLVSTLSQPLAAGLKLTQQGRDYQLISLKDRQSFRPLPAQQPQAIRADQAPSGARQVQWRADRPASLVFAQTVNAEQPSDSLWQVSAPFTQAAQPLLQLPQRLYRWFSDRQGGLVLAGWTHHQQQMSWYLWQEQRLTELKRFNYRDNAADPGLPYHLELPDGRTELVRSAAGVFWFLRPDGQRFFASAAQTLQPQQQDQQWRPLYWPDPEKPQQMLAFSNEPGRQDRYWWLGSQANAESAQPVVDWLAADALRLPAAVDLSLAGVQGRLYLPSAQCPKPFPVLVWLYPDPKVAPLEAVLSPESPFFALRQCVAVLDLAGVAVQSNTLLRLVARHPALDVQRIVLMGHSYGANAVIELLAQSDRFAGGIARSGAYNRTLTPLGFQRQPEPIWQQTTAYLQASPLIRADRIRAPVLLVHGERDQNPGTLPLQSEQLFMVLQHQQQDAELLLLPAEGHHYQQRTNLRELLRVQADWLARVTALPANTASSSHRTPDKG